LTTLSAFDSRLAAIVSFASRARQGLEPTGYALPKSGVVGLDCAGKPEPGTARLLFLFPSPELLRLLG
jgi:hypothetical protein